MKIKNIQGFTLVELMIVIAIIGIFIYGAIGMMNSQNTKQQKVIQFAEWVEDIFTSTKQHMVIGRGTLTGTIGNQIIIPNTSRRIQVTSDSILVQYMPEGEIIWKEDKKYDKPFIEGDNKYTIESIKTSSGRITPEDALTAGEIWKDTANPLIVNFGADGDMTLTGSSSFMITLEYEGFRRYIVGDVVSDIITTYRQPVK